MHFILYIFSKQQYLWHAQGRKSVTKLFTYCFLLCTDWNMEQIFWSNRLTWRMDQAMHWCNKQCSSSVKFHCIIFHLCRYTIKLLCRYQFHPKPSPRDMTWREQKPSPGRNIVYKKPPLGTNRESKAPPPGHNVKNFIYKPWHCLKWKALWSQQIKRFFSEETAWLLLWYISFGGHHSQTTECMKALNDMYNHILIIFWEKGAWNFTKNISNFCRFLLSLLIVSVLLEFFSYLFTQPIIYTLRQIFQSTPNIKWVTNCFAFSIFLWSEKLF